jgi:hypothetical protein
MEQGALGQRPGGQRVNGTLHIIHKGKVKLVLLFLRLTRLDTSLI